LCVGPRGDRYRTARGDGSDPHRALSQGGRATGPPHNKQGARTQLLLDQIPRFRSRVFSPRAKFTRVYFCLWVNSLAVFQPPPVGEARRAVSDASRSPLPRERVRVGRGGDRHRTARGDGLDPHPTLSQRERGLRSSPPALSPREREFTKCSAPGAMGFFGPAAAGPQNDSVSWRGASGAMGFFAPPGLRMTAFLGRAPGAGGGKPRPYTRETRSRAGGALDRDGCRPGAPASRGD
jgi:hypothetical protein